MISYNLTRKKKMLDLCKNSREISILMSLNNIPLQLLSLFSLQYISFFFFSFFFFYILLLSSVSSDFASSKRKTKFAHNIFRYYQGPSHLSTINHSRNYLDYYLHLSFLSLHFVPTYSLTFQSVCCTLDVV